MADGEGARRLGIAVVGCGEAAQIMHLPALRRLDDLFEVRAVCDASRRVAEEVGRLWAVPARFDVPAEAVAADGVDAVLVTTPDAFHADVVLAALAAGKHVLVEKPMCMTLREADEIAAARARSGTIVQVGYMRRYAPAFVDAARIVPTLGPVRFAHVRHLLGLNELISRPTARVVTGEIEPALAEEGRRRREQLLKEATGDAPPAIRDAYSLLLSLASHDLSAARELLGVPRGVLYARTWHDGWLLTGALDYGSFACHFEIGFDRIPRVEAHVAIHGERSSLTVPFATSYVRNLPVRLTVLEANATGGTDERRVHHAWGDPFVEEWRAFHRHVADGVEPKTSPADFRLDLELFRDLATAMARHG